MDLVFFGALSLVLADEEFSAAEDFLRLKIMLNLFSILFRRLKKAPPTLSAAVTENPLGSSQL